MANFSPELYKAASGAKSLPINTARTDEPFTRPVYEDYAAKGDLTGYMTALWKGAAARDVECLQVLLYLAIRAHEPEDALDLMAMLLETEDEGMLGLAEKLYQIVQDAKNWPKEIYEDEKKYKAKLSIEFENALCRPGTPDSLFDDAEPTLLRAYINNVGRQPEVEAPKEDEEIEIRNLVTQEKKDYWRSLYRRDDCSSNQEAIYHEALGYAEKGDPYAMFIVGYLLNHGIKTKYSHPAVTILECNHEKALPWLKRAAEAGIVEACWETACALWGACYVSTTVSECTPEMRSYIEKGAEMNDKQCLEWLYKTTKDDDEKSFGYLARLAAQNGTHKYKLELAKRYEEGRGCAKDEKKAFELAEYVWKNSSASPYSSSAEDSVDLLCRYLREGIGCEKNPERAGDIRSSYDDEEDRMWELLTK